jgi:hypothetical protein
MLLSPLVKGRGAERDRAFGALSRFGPVRG